MADLTEDEELELELEQARARKAQEDAAEANAAAGVTDSVEGNQLLGAGKSFVRGIGRGIVSIPDAPAAVYTGIKNLPKRAYNTFGGERPVESDNHGDAPMPVAVQPTGPARPLAYPQAPSEDQQLPLDTAPRTPISSAYDASFPVDENHPYADMFGSVAGPAIVEAAATGGGSLLTIPGALNATRRAGATTTGTLLGSGVGGGVDRALGGSGDIGSVIGGGFVGGVLPTVPTQAGWKGLSTLFTDRNSPGLLTAARDAGVPESLGLVGKKIAGQVEDATAALPFAGGPAFKAREAQYAAMDAEAQRIAAQMRGGPSDVRGINPSTIGDKVYDAANAAETNAKAAQDAALNPLYQTIGRDTPIDQTTQLDQMETIRRGSQPQYRAPVDAEIAGVNASRLDPLNPPKVVDPGLEAQLQMKMNQAQRKLQGASTPKDAQAAQDELDSLQAQQTANRGQTFQETIETRSKTGRRVEGQQPLDAEQTLKIKEAQTAAMKQAAQLVGVSPEEFDAANARYGELAVQREIFDRIANAPGQGEAYNRLFGGTSRQNLKQLNALYEQAPDQLRAAMADEFELRFRGKGGAGLPPRADTLGPAIKTAPDWWSSIPHEARAYVSPGPQIDNQADNLSALMRADARRPSRTAPGSGGNTLGIGSIFASAFGGVPNALAFGTGKLFTNPRFVNRVVNPGPWVNDTNTLARIMAGAYGAGETGAH